MSAFYLVGFENALVNQSISSAFVNATNIIILESYRRTLARLAYLEARNISPPKHIEFSFGNPRGGGLYSATSNLHIIC